MKLAALFLFAAAVARAEGEAPKAAPPPVETVKVTDQPDADLFERIRGAHIRAEKSGQIAVNTAASAPATR